MQAQAAPRIQISVAEGTTRQANAPALGLRWTWIRRLNGRLRREKSRQVTRRSGVRDESSWLGRDATHSATYKRDANDWDI